MYSRAEENSSQLPQMVMATKFNNGKNGFSDMVSEFLECLLLNKLGTPFQLSFKFA